MARINTQKQTIDIPHPTLKGLKVVAKKLEPIEAMDVFAQMQQYQKVVVLTHPQTGEVLYDDDGNPRVHMVSNIPVSAILDVLENILEGWEELEDENGKAIPFKRENFKFLFKKELNCTVKRTVKDPKTQKETQKDVSISYADYIQQIVNESAVEPEEQEAKNAN